MMAFFDEIEEETWQSKQSFETLHLFRLEKEFETPIPLYRKTVLLLKDHLNPAFTDMRFFGSDIPINRSSAQTLSSQIGVNEYDQTIQPKQRKILLSAMRICSNRVL